MSTNSAAVRDVSCHMYFTISKERENLFWKFLVYHSVLCARKLLCSIYTWSESTRGSFGLAKTLLVFEIEDEFAAFFGGRAVRVDLHMKRKCRTRRSFDL